VASVNSQHRAAAGHRFATGLFDPARGLLRVVMLVEIADQHIGALAREGDGDGAANAGIGAGDQRGAALELPGAFVGVLAVIGTRLHLARLARRLLLRRFEGRLRGRRLSGRRRASSSFPYPNERRKARFRGAACEAFTARRLAPSWNEECLCNAFRSDCRGRSTQQPIHRVVAVVRHGAPVSTNSTPIRHPITDSY